LREIAAPNGDARGAPRELAPAAKQDIQSKASRVSDQLMIDAIGFAAASLVLATFCMRTMGALRWVALASNLVFIAYGYLGNLAPVLLLHALLLPVNAYRLTQLWWADGVRSERTEQKDTIMAGKGGRTRHSGRTMAALSPLIFVLAVLAAGTAQAHSVRYISSTGSDSSNCTRATPCLTLQRGIGRTAAGSELIILDSGDFGDGATIDKSITITAAGVSATLGAGITINATAAVVVLRGLRLNGGGAGADGIEIVTGATAQVHVEDCEVQGFENGIVSGNGANGIEVTFSGKATPPGRQRSTTAAAAISSVPDRSPWNSP
jgi:hypothetical protein